MNLVKASSVLYPILGENVSDIILKYLKPTKKKTQPDKPNLYGFFDEYVLDKSQIDRIFEELRDIHDENECNESWMTNKNCVVHEEICEDCMDDYDLEKLILDTLNLPIWISDRYGMIRQKIRDNIDHFGLVRKMINAFIADLSINECEN